MDSVRIGVIGAGNIAQLNLPGYLEHPRCEVVALCEPRDDVGREKARHYGIPRVYGSVDDLLADPDIDAVEVLSPTHLHAEHTIAALRAGKHVSCQKPIAGSVADARRMVSAAAEHGRMLRVTENCCFYPPLVRARELVRDGAIGRPTVIRIKTVCGETTSRFQANLDPSGYVWRFNDQSPGGHLFDDVMHKYAMALWLVDEEVRSVQAVVRRGPLFFEAPTVALFEYARDDLLGMMEVSYAPDMFIESDYYGADEFFEIQGESGYLWVTRLTGRLTGLPPLVLYTGDGRSTTFGDLDADYGVSFRHAARAFVDGLLAGTVPDLDPGTAIRALQLAFAVYRASAERTPVNPASIEDAAGPPWWPPTEDDLRRDVEEMFDRSRRRGRSFPDPGAL